MATNAKRNKSSGEECANNHSTRLLGSLSADIIFEILLRVTARDVLPLKTVCKLWYNLISSREFAKAHLCYWKSTSEIIIRCSYVDDFQSLDTRTMKIHELSLKNFLTKFVGVYDSLDGLVLFRGTENKLYICNPVTRRIRLLLRMPAAWTSNYEYYKLVFDAQQQKYKIMGFCYRYGKETIDKRFVTLTGLGDEEGPMPHWRDLRRHVCRGVGTSFWHCLESFRFTPITINGVLHWIGFTDEKQEGTKLASVQSLDIANEKFKERIELPCQPAPSCIKSNCKLLEVKGSLFVTIPTSAVDLDIWLLNDWDKLIWSKQHKICLESTCGKPTELQSFFYDYFEAILIINWDNNLKNFILEVCGNWYLDWRVKNSQKSEPFGFRSHTSLP